MEHPGGRTFRMGAASGRPRQGDMKKRSVITIEADVGTAVVRFQREQQGRGAALVRAHILGDMIVVRSSDVLTPAEVRLTATEEGRRLIRSLRQELRSINHDEIERVISEIAECAVLRSYCDMSVEAAEQIEVYVLADDMMKSLLRQDLDRLNGMAPRRGP